MLWINKKFKQNYHSVCAHALNISTYMQRNANRLSPCDLSFENRKLSWIKILCFHLLTHISAGTAMTRLQMNDSSLTRLAVIYHFHAALFNRNDYTLISSHLKSSSLNITSNRTISFSNNLTFEIFSSMHSATVTYFIQPGNSTCRNALIIGYIVTRYSSSVIDFIPAQGDDP